MNFLYYYQTNNTSATAKTNWNKLQSLLQNTILQITCTLNHLYLCTDNYTQNQRIKETNPYLKYSKLDTKFRSPELLETSQQPLYEFVLPI